MSIEFFLFPSNMPSTEGKFLARVETGKAVGLDAIAQQIADSGLTASRSEILGILSRACEVIESRLIEGSAVQFGGVCTLRPTIRGIFANGDSSFDPDVNSIEVAASAGPRIRKAVREQASAEKIGRPQPSPNLLDYSDIMAASHNETITCGGLGQLTGTDLDFNPEAPDEGLFLVTNVDLTGVKVTYFQKSTATQAVFMVPQAGPSAEDGYFVLKRRNRPTGPLVTGQSVPMMISFAPAAVAVG